MLAVVPTLSSAQDQGKNNKDEDVGNSFIQTDGNLPRHMHKRQQRYDDENFIATADDTSRVETGRDGSSEFSSERPLEEQVHHNVQKSKRHVELSMRSNPTMTRIDVNKKAAALISSGEDYAII